MSVIVNANNQLIFGNQSPLYRVVTEQGLKDTFTHMIIDKSTTVYRKRAFDTYVLANNVFPDKSAEINNNVRYAIGKLLDPFINKDIKIANDFIFKIPRQKYSQGEISLTNEISKATGIKNALVMVVDSEKENITSCHGIITYLTKNTTNGTCSQLDTSWSNGFFTFKDSANTSVLIFIPKQYIASLLTFTLSKYKSIGDSHLDNINIKGELVDAFSIDLIKSFFSAIYADGIRNRVTSDILLVNSLLLKEGSIATAISEDSGDNVKGSDVFSKYAIDLHQFKASSNSEHFVYELLKLLEFKTKVIINPYEFYKAFLDTPYVQILNVFEKIPNFKRLDSKYCSNYNFSNNLFDMDNFNADKDRDIITHGLKLIRFLPFLLFNTYVLGGGAYHTETKTIINNIKTFNVSLLSFRASNPLTSPMIKFISDNLNYLTNTFFEQISSPINITSRSKQSLSIAINRYGIVNDDINLENTSE